MKILKYYKVAYIMSGVTKSFKRSFLVKAEYDAFIQKLNDDPAIEGYVESTNTIKI